MSFSRDKNVLSCVLQELFHSYIRKKTQLQKCANLQLLKFVGLSFVSSFASGHMTCLKTESINHNETANHRQLINYWMFPGNASTVETIEL